MNARRGLSLLLLLLALASGVGYALQRAEATALQREIAWLEDEQRAAERLRAENERLRAAQPPDAQLQRLRADHAAIARLRAEIETLQRRATQVSP